MDAEHLQVLLNVRSHHSGKSLNLARKILRWEPDQWFVQWDKNWQRLQLSGSRAEKVISARSLFSVATGHWRGTLWSHPTQEDHPSPIAGLPLTTVETLSSGRIFLFSNSALASRSSVISR